MNHLIEIADLTIENLLPEQVYPGDGTWISCIYHLLCLPFNRNDHLEGTCMMGSISKAVNAANTTKTVTKVMTWRDSKEYPP